METMLQIEISSSNVHQQNKQRKKLLTDRIYGYMPARLVLYLLSWSAYIVSFMMRNDINLAITAMVADPPRISMNITNDYCYTTDNDTISIINYGGTLQWSEKVQGYVLPSYYFGYIISQIPSGMLIQRLGSKTMLGYSQLVTALCSFNIPWASNTHYSLTVLLKFSQGFVSGCTWPAMLALIARWTPIHERSRFMSSFQGNTIGIGVIYPLAGYLSGSFGWPYVFYATGTLGICWCIFWYFLAFESPEIHPRISSTELKYIEQNTIHIANVNRNKTPWKIYRSLPVWAIGIVNFGRMWATFTFMIPGPRYMKNILGFSIEKNGLLSGLPFICSYASTVVFCYVADMLIAKQIISLLRVRKLMTAVSSILPGIIVIFIGNVGCNINLAMVMWFAAVMLLSAGYGGSMANIMDIAPNFAAPVLALCNTILMLASFLSPIAAFHILDGKDNGVSSWRMVFYLTTFVSFFTYIVYHSWSSAEIQPWNYESEPQAQEEMKELNTDRDSNMTKITSSTVEALVTR